MENIIFTTTDGYPVYIGDTYHIVVEEGIQHWLCDTEDDIPTSYTYKVFENARDVKLGKHIIDTSFKNKGAFITEEKINED